MGGKRGKYIFFGGYQPTLLCMCQLDPDLFPSMVGAIEEGGANVMVQHFFLILFFIFSVFFISLNFDLSSEGSCRNMSWSPSNLLSSLFKIDLLKYRHCSTSRTLFGIRAPEFLLMPDLLKPGWRLIYRSLARDSGLAKSGFWSPIIFVFSRSKLFDREYLIESYLIPDLG